MDHQPHELRAMHSPIAILVKRTPQRARHHTPHLLQCFCVPKLGMSSWSNGSAISTTEQRQELVLVQMTVVADIKTAEVLVRVASMFPIAHIVCIRPDYRQL
jgi:hypothetical protein